ncbi:hypothetical protein BPO_1532 [Bergeyella porcorum]|uniref:Uncharacterized protein n=1 Tax=Bergeyella porcorum TaxID=1735111 RepID=A0AAU0F2K7_9FLAO
MQSKKREKICGGIRRCSENNGSKIRNGCGSKSVDSPSSKKSINA